MPPRPAAPPMPPRPAGAPVPARPVVPPSPEMGLVRLPPQPPCVPATAAAATAMKTALPFTPGMLARLPRSAQTARVYDASLPACGGDCQQPRRGLPVDPATSQGHDDELAQLQVRFPLASGAWQTHHPTLSLATDSK